MERLEDRRVLSAASLPIATSAEVVPFITVDGDPADFLVDPADPIDGFTGVVELTIELSIGTGRCSGALLTTGWHNLTAAHCFTDEVGNRIDTSTSVHFDLTSERVTNDASDVVTHELFEGTRDIHNGYDIAILTLSEPAPADAERYDIYRGFDDATGATSILEFVGYGRTGTGETGEQPGTGGQKRRGYNIVEDTTSRITFVPGLENASPPSDSLLAFDFDNSCTTTSCNEHNAAADVMALESPDGLGVDLEIGIAHGDSGGPAFFNGQVAGVHSFGKGFAPEECANCDDLDPVPGTNSSFGELFWDTRVSYFQDWIDDTIIPQVMDVDIDSSVSQHGLYDVPAGSGDQIGTLPVADPDTFTVQFNEDVTIDAADFSLTSAIDGATYALAATGGFSYDPATFTATFVLANAVTTPDQLVLQIADAVTDAAGNFLDGEWTNPTHVDDTGTSTFPSGDDSPGGDFQFYLTVLPGDGDRGNWVDGADQNLVLGNWGMQPAVWTNGDTSGNSLVEQADLDDVQSFWGTDFRSWPAGGSGAMGTMSGPTLTDPLTGLTITREAQRRQSFLESLDGALAEICLEDFLVDTSHASANEATWDAFMDDLARALDGHYVVSTD